MWGLDGGVEQSRARRCRGGSVRPNSLNSTARSRRTRPTAMTWLSTVMPNSPSRALAIAPTATRARFRGHWRAPGCSVRHGSLLDGAARSAWPGPDGLGVALVFRAGDILNRKRVRPVFPIAIANQNGDGEPMVCEWRTPATISARSVSIFMRPPGRTCWRRQSSRLTASREIGCPPGVR